MSDQGEKIVSLAYELLQAPNLPPALPPAPRMVSLRMLCVAAVIAALGGSGITEFANEALRPLNRYEKTELKALVYYAAQLKGIDQTALRTEVEEKFKVASLDDLTQGEFPIVRRYLQEKSQ